MSSRGSPFGLCGAQPETDAPDVRLLAQRRRRVLGDVASLFEHVRTRRDAERQRDDLLDQEHRHAYYIHVVATQAER